MSLVLVVDDVAAICEQYAYDLRRLGGHEVLEATSGREALAVLDARPVECMILDLEMPGMDGFELLARMRARGIDLPVVVYTGTGDFERCVRAVKLGACSFIDKREPMEKVIREIDAALASGRLVNELRHRHAGDESSPIIGDSPAIRRLREAIARVAPISSPVLVTGESGSGKELVARELHRLSGRPRQIFLATNCAALAQNLVESELFGHEAGAFTGAARRRRGLFEQATGGTLFLDEIGEIAAPAQAKLLRVLEERRVTRVGGESSIAVDARVVAATHRDLERDVADGRFRRDLFFRLNVHTVRVPPLRERLQDIPVLVGHLAAKIGEQLGVPPRRFSAAALARFGRHDWRRNNVRELRNAVERVLVASTDPLVQEADVDRELAADRRGTPSEGAAVRGAQPGGGNAGAGQRGGGRSLREMKLEAERSIVRRALERNGWHVTRTAEELGLADHASLLKIMRRLGLKRASKE